MRLRLSALAALRRAQAATEEDGALTELERKLSEETALRLREIYDERGAILDVEHGVLLTADEESDEQKRNAPIPWPPGPEEPDAEILVEWGSESAERA